jgi:hypothetical protein
LPCLQNATGILQGDFDGCIYAATALAHTAVAPTLVLRTAMPRSHAGWLPRSHVCRHGLVLQHSDAHAYARPHPRYPSSFTNPWVPADGTCAVAVQGGFHGRTYAAMALTSSKVIYKQHFGPLVPGVHIAPYPYCLHCKVQQEKVRGEGLLRGGDR